MSRNRTFSYFVYFSFHILLLYFRGVTTTPELIESKRVRQFTVKEVASWTKEFGKKLITVAETATQVDALLKNYDKHAKVYEYDPEQTLDNMIIRLEEYFNKRKSLAKDLHASLIAGDSTYDSVEKSKIEASANCLKKKKAKVVDFVATDILKCYKELTNKNYDFVDARQKQCKDDDCKIDIDYAEENRTEFIINGVKNPNFYMLEVDTTKSAVHVPTTTYKFSLPLLEEIHWSGEILNSIFIDKRKTANPSASWQFYCSTKGFMRFYPATNWLMQDKDPSGLKTFDLYDCRTSEWFIDGATNAKNVLIVLDMSGSMHGQRFAIGKRTVFTILQTLSENDFFNIITYNENPQFVLPMFNATLIQATYRNKLLMCEYFDGDKSPDGFANLTKALEMAFETLRLNKTKTMGCNSAIMLITDGAPRRDENIFEHYNADKKIRFFSFLIGNDVTNSQEVQHMACNNRGFFVHITQFNEIEEKVQKYIEIMSKAASKLNHTREIWTGAYIDKMLQSNSTDDTDQQIHHLVSTVAFPVVINSTFRGVVGASAPITELQQMASVYRLGANAYAFLVDNNGNVMFHPQLRPFYFPAGSKKLKEKPNYNSMDIMELEVLEANSVKNESVYPPIEIPIPVNYSSLLRTYLADGTSSRTVEPEERKILLAMESTEGEGPRRVYRQHNNYYFRAINQTLMSLGLAIPTTSKYIIQFREKYDYQNIDFKCFEGSNWRLHPDWHYCRANDTDFNKTKEDVFKHYLQQIKQDNKLPNKCADFKFLINLLLCDVKVTCYLESEWISKARVDARNGVLLVFLVTQSGLTRFVDMNLDDVVWEQEPKVDQNGNVTEKINYTPFVWRNAKGLDENFYQRALRYPEGEYLFDVDVKNTVNLKHESKTFDHLAENRSMLVTAFRSVYLKNGAKSAPVGVIGMEMLYGSLAEMVHNATGKQCSSNNLGVRCYLLDEQGFILYTSVTSDLVDLTSYLRHFFGWAPKIEGEETYNLDPSVPADKAETIVFTKLVEKGFYENLTYIDYQGVCSQADMQKMFAPSFASRLLTPFQLIFKIFIWIFNTVAIFLADYGWFTYTTYTTYTKPVEATTQAFCDKDHLVPCDRWTSFYYLNDSKMEAEELLHHDVPCFRADTSANGVTVLDETDPVEFCSVSAVASRVPGMNLMFIILEVSGKNASVNCYSPNCVETFKQKYGAGFDMKIVLNASEKISVANSGDKTLIETRHRRPPSVCLPAADEETETCARGFRVKPSGFPTVLFLMNLDFFIIFLLIFNYP